MSLSKNIKVKKFDKRVVEWNLRNGVITQDEYQQHLQELADEQTKTEKTTVFNERLKETELLN